MESNLEEKKQIVYNWIDEISLSRIKKNINRDFADAVLAAEVIRHFIPKIVDIHNYSTCNSVTQKIANWEILNKKVLKKLGFQLSKNEVQALANSLPDAIEKALFKIKDGIESYKQPISPIEESKSIKEVPRIQPISREIDNEILADKEQTIMELKETIEIMESKIKKLEQLTKLKDSKIQMLTNILSQNGIANA